MATLTLRGDAAGAVKAVEDLNKALDETRRRGKNATEELTKTELMARRLAAQADPQERHNQQMQKLADAVERGGLSMEHAERQAVKYRKQLDEAGKSTDKAFGSEMIAKVGRAATAYFGIQSALSAIKSEFAAIQAASDRASERQFSAAQGRQTLLSNIFDLPDDQRKQIFSRARSIARSADLPLGAIEGAVGQSISALGDPTKALDVVEATAKVTRTPEGLATMSGAVGDIMNALGTHDPQRALGFLALSQKNMRITDFRRVATNLPPVVNSIVKAGSNPVFASALMAAITTGAADPLGEQSRTASLQIVKNAMKFTGEERADVAIQKLMSDSRLGRSFLAENEGEARVLPAMQGLFGGDPSSPERRKFDLSFSTLQDAANQRQAGVRMQGIFESDPLLRRLRMAQSIESANEQSRIDERILSGKELQGITDLHVRATGDTHFMNDLRMRMAFGTEISEREAISFLEGSIESGESFQRAGRTEGVEALKQMRFLLEEMRDRAVGDTATRGE